MAFVHISIGQANIAFK